MAKAKTQQHPTGKSPTATPTAHATYHACYQRFAPLAADLPERDVEVCRADVRIAFANVKRGVQAACAEPARIRRALPELPLDDVLALPDLGRALVFAATRVTAKPASSREIDAKLKLVIELREPMLTLAETLAKRGLLPKDVVAEIRAGSGKYDLASDGMALAHLYEEHAAALRGKHPFTQEELDQLREASEWLLDTLTPEGARRPAAKQRGEAEKMRDRLWTLLVRRYADLRKIAYYFHGDAFEDVTPKLLSRLSSSAAEDESDEAEADDDGSEDAGGGDRGGAVEQPASPSSP
ncbi:MULTISPECIES: hypothetical protein [Sorangium]|uniref:Uncharacterized protein n=1 Tax=Sorangium cellulosum TaxID=56 RepID=A0A4P2QRC9_SORCE|nr:MULTISPECIES: hypothetical protein [Sorangium]AUX32735.1 hypothetical protein SOCE836_048820 [Sorangium cellulosum]WCQ92111.1 hypothetical protein NQZ70_04842 [Sorangium sp. Soce836]